MISGKRIYTSRNGERWAEFISEGFYKIRAGHVIYTGFYSNDKEAIRAAKLVVKHRCRV